MDIFCRPDLNIYRTFTAKLRPDLYEESIKFNALFPGDYYFQIIFERNPLKIHNSYNFY